MEKNTTVSLKFHAELDKIEGKYPQFFKDKLDDKGDPDKLTYHYLMRWDSSRVEFAIKGDSTLPQYLKDEIMDCFKNNFKNN